MNTGFIKLHRQFLKWEWYDDINVKVLFLHCLFRANWEEQKWHGEFIPRGSFVTSLQNLAKETNLSIQQTRTALKKLNSTKEITKKSQGSNTLITVNNYNKYQDNNKEITNYQQTNNKQITTIEEIKKEKNTTTTYSDENSQKIYGKYNNVCLTAEQYNRLLARCTSQKLLNELIDSLSANIETGKEQPFRADFPNAHSIRLERYREYRIKNPQKFNAKLQKTEVVDDRSHIFKELEAEARAQGRVIL